MKFLTRLFRREPVVFPEDYVPLKHVGWGPFPLPGEKRRDLKAHLKAKEIMAQVEAASKR